MRTNNLFNWTIDVSSTWPPLGKVKPPYGPTAIEVIRLCPLRFIFENSSGYERRIGFDARIGTAFHRTLQHTSSLTSQESPRKVAEIVREYFIKEVRLQENEAGSRPRERGLPRNQERIQVALEILVSIALNQPQNQNNMSIHGFYVKQRTSGNFKNYFEVEVPVSSEDDIFCGRIDCVEHSDKGIFLLDYKLSKRIENVERYEFQMQMYGAMWFQTRKSWPTGAKLVYPLQGKSIDVDIKPESCDKVMQEARSLVNLIRGKNSPTQLAKPGDNCKVCDFRPWCQPFWDRQADCTLLSEALAKAEIGFEGIVEEIDLKNHFYFILLKWQGILIQITVPQERFPHLRFVSKESRLRLLDTYLHGLRHNPKIRITEISELFVLSN